MGTKKPKFYAVRVGRKTGIFTSWQDCEDAISGYSGAVYKRFENEVSAREWFDGVSSSLFGQETADNNQKDFVADYDVYTDGSYFEGRYAWAYAFVKDDKVVYEDSNVGKNPQAATMHNVAGELAAVLYAVRRAAQMGVRIRIHHDYEGIAFWVTGEWRTKNEFTQAYAKLMMEHQGIYQFTKVQAHTGDTYNEYVDSKAKKALGITK
ncbi:MAG: ribonuclease H1 domain-containing protein [Desulfitobacteriaceae bacterium]